MTTTSGQLPRIIHTGTEIHSLVSELRRDGRRVGLVPTMGALHEGHLSLARAARRECDYTVGTIFVNPTQFGPQEDFQRYPRTLEVDVRAFATCAVDAVFVPAAEEIYPTGFSTYVEPPSVSRRWEGACRSGHFRGVATVVLKLFNLIPAHVGFFGHKDYQQCQVIRHMVADLNVPIEIRVCPTVREPDGLAMSSRNQYLSAEERERARALYRGLELARQLVASGVREAESLQRTMCEYLQSQGISPVDYAAVVAPDTLEPVPQITGQVVVLLAARVGSTRLIDNCVIEAELP
jgi:pantoate--beta-alanine ligase